MPTDIFEREEYALRHLIGHMHSAGLTRVKIEEFIQSFPPETDTYYLFASQHIEHLPEQDRPAAKVRLQMDDVVKVTVLSKKDQPFFFLALVYEASEIDRIVFLKFGRQPSGAPHRWQGDK